MIVRGKNSERVSMFGIEEREMILCKTCGDLTPMLGTKLCNGCWEVESRLSSYLVNKKAICFVLKAVFKGFHRMIKRKFRR